VPALRLGLAAASGAEPPGISRHGNSSTIMNLCKLIGHKIEYPMAPDDYRLTQCKRCHLSKHEAYGDEPLRSWPSEIRYWTANLRRKIKDWLRNFFKPCCDCGKRFGAHDKTVDHLPF
jgi:hypothetical protein